MRTRLRSKFALLFIVCAALLAFAGTAMALTTDTSGNTAPAPTIQSDKADYAPGELVTLTGSGWQSGESVNIVVNDDEGQTWNRNVNVIADESGSIRDSFNLPDWFVAAYSVTATGSSGTATTSFTDARVVTTATLNGGNSVNVQAGSSMNANVSVTTDGSGANARWRSTGWRIATTAPNATSDVTCVNTPNHDSAGTNNESFSINAPNAAGTYNAYFIAFSDDACTWAPSGGAGQSNTFTLTNGVVATPTTQTLTVTKDGTGTGTVTSSPTGINCGTTCSANFNNGASVTLTANPDANSTFASWSGDGTGTTTRSVTMDADKSVSALFKANQAALNYTGPTSGTYGDKLTLSSSGGDGTGAVTYEATGTACELGTGADAGKLLITSGTGTCSVEVKKAGDNNYNAASSGPQTITVNKANQSITFGPLSNQTVGATFTVSATASSNLPVSFSAGPMGTCTISGTNVSVTGPGTCTITAKQPGDNNYNAATDVSQSFNASYTFFGWLQPVDGDGTATGTVNMGKVGRTYPIKWQLKEYVNGSLQLISDTTAQALVSSMSGMAKKANCSTFVGSDALEEYTAGATQLRYDATSDQFIYNYKAPSSPVCQAFVVSKADGVNDKQANFNFTK